MTYYTLECDACQRTRECTPLDGLMLCGECAERESEELAGRVGDEADRRKCDRADRKAGR